MAGVPVEMPVHRKPGVLVRRVRNVSGQGHKPVLRLLPPGLVVLGQHRRGIQPVSEVKVVVVVPTGTKILMPVIQTLLGRRAVPRGVVHDLVQAVFAVLPEPGLKGVVHDPVRLVHKRRLLQLFCDQRDAGNAANPFPEAVGVRCHPRKLEILLDLRYNLGLLVGGNGVKALPANVDELLFPGPLGTSDPDHLSQDAVVYEVGVGVMQARQDVLVVRQGKYERDATGVLPIDLRFGVMVANIDVHGATGRDALGVLVQDGLGVLDAHHPWDGCQTHGGGLAGGHGVVVPGEGDLVHGVDNPHLRRGCLHHEGGALGLPAAGGDDAVDGEDVVHDELDQGNDFGVDRSHVRHAVEGRHHDLALALEVVRDGDTHVVVVRHLMAGALRRKPDGHPVLPPLGDEVPVGGH
mmetsp:Transcript_114338/g.198814  ORF Transcript_114338/g.198814 Transcript_114338/m.198814 type:complete len:407 (+) Transcript_114338:904-2124(+)